ncbi:peroxiredoxin-like family protein [Reichenbachiella versicolor]|uniref:peroxiredoxin-like family protein n=1 Tax=Reichenbachiella versicolor TaxID=1821036 RepID=UPI000D6E3EEA|nr:peroxiredoxin-like family protein [Reichenbachiella versicolor]
MKKLESNQKVIPFASIDVNGEKIDINEYKGQKLLLSFFRKAACPFCNMAMQQLIKRHAEFESKGIKVVALFASSKKDVLKYAGSQNPPFSIIADEKFDIYRKYGIQISFKGMLQTMLVPSKVWKAMKGGFFSLRTVPEDPVLPAEFLINEDQSIHRAYYGSDFDDHLPIDDILQWK